MPPGFQSEVPQAKGENTAAPLRPKALLGWVVKSTAATIRDGALQISPAGGQPFLANAKVRVNGPVGVGLRIRSTTGGMARLQWRLAGQDTFPEDGQRQTFEIAGGDWQQLRVPLDVPGQLVHIRLFLPNAKQATEIDWIEIASQDGGSSDRWDFGKSAQ